MQFTAAQISELINGRIEGNPDIIVTSFGKIEEAKEGQLTFLANLKYESFLYTTTASLVILNEDFVLKQPIHATLIRVADAYAAFVILLNKYQEMKTQQMKGIQQPAYLSPTAQLGKDVFVGAFAYLGENVKIGDHAKIYPNAYIGDNVQIGDHCIIHPGVKIYSGCVVQNNVIIHAGTVIGGDGFGFVPQADGNFKKVPQIGNVVIEDNVEIGCNTTIDRATIGSTTIKKGAKLDNLIQIAHNVEIGNSTVIAAQAGISGSTKIGNNVMIGGQAGFAHHIQVADGVKIGGQAGVTRSIKTSNISVNDTPAFDYVRTLRSQAIYKNLPDLRKEIDAMKEEIKQLKTTQA